MRLRGQEELRCTYRLTGRTRCLPARQQCNMSKPNVLMNARLQRLGRYYEGKPVLVWCYPLQELPNGIRVDGDGDWAPTTELLRRSTSGGAVRYGSHTWDCYSVTQATIALSSAESEFYATGSATARGLQCKVYLSETERPCELDVYSDSTAGRGMCQRTGRVGECGTRRFR